ncbi:uncharacterized protein N7479_000440 [Penicillium vulpinum]|uniref:Apple domain-containing protein n=1 Tax=Penicillium vulpinum TaxID=29845 RepID=A0A1V6S597_9EURO|nr:uncharacterized protein N7479_000440 [Penicillium vulpinum]KAJ5970522.1 hypothetical protein N7479_000440 [Penicillium vulpinum]OQE09221.1 hypothetical protein PENVUL_c007G05933 [Penicillium vulpinum]
MVLKSTLLLLSAASALAQQTPLGASCLSSPDPAGCCTQGEVQGEETVGGVNFQYTCGFAPSPSKLTGHTVATAHECAELCAQDDNCFGASWRTSGSSARGNCFFAIGEDFESKETSAFMLLARAPEPVPDPPCLASPEANACCTDGRTGGEELVGDVLFKYTCGSVPTPSKFKGHNVASAFECAELCAKDETCFATSWRTTGSNARGNCFFAMSQNFDPKSNNDHMLIARVIETTPDPTECEAENKQCMDDKNRCEGEKQVHEAAHNQCETDKKRAENAERECLRNTNEITEKKRQCREEQQQCHEEKAQQAIQCQEDKAEQALINQHCQNQNNQLALDIIKQRDEISDLQSTITTLQSTLDNLNSTYLALNKECKGESCRAGVVNAEQRDDGCILPAGNKNFKIYYAKLDDPGAWDLGTPKTPSFADCAQLCARTPRCVRFAWATSNREGTCWMRSHGQERKPTKFSAWSSGQLV